MKKKPSENEQETLMDCIVHAMQDKKARNIVSIDLRNIKNAFTDHFVICHGTSGPHVEAIGNFIEEMTLKKFRQKPFQKEGFENKEWILLDYFDIIVHIFLEDKRDFYSIEELWNDGITTQINEDTPVSVKEKLKTKSKQNDRKTRNSR
jgi:ribosome-associated protein